MQDIMRYCNEKKNWTERYWDGFITIRSLYGVKRSVWCARMVEKMNKTREEYPRREVEMTSTV
jgi:hypothetical protein